MMIASTAINSRLVFLVVCYTAISCVGSIRSSGVETTDATELTERRSASENDGDASAFCEGMYMVMFMDGFHWSTVWRKGATTPACLNYFVATWKLENASAFFGACFFSFLLAILLESFVAARSFALKWMPRTTLPAVSMVLYVLQALLGYILMIVTMTFSIELIGSVVFGLIVGNFIFSSYDEVDAIGADNHSIANDGGTTLDERTPLNEEPLQSQASLSDDRSTSLLRRRGER